MNADFSFVMASVWICRRNPPFTTGCRAGVLFLEFCGVSSSLVMWKESVLSIMLIMTMEQECALGCGFESVQREAEVKLA